MSVNECKYVYRGYNEKNEFTKFQTVKGVMKEFCNKSTFFIFKKKPLDFVTFELIKKNIFN